MLIRHKLHKADFCIYVLWSIKIVIYTYSIKTAFVFQHYFKDWCSLIWWYNLTNLWSHHQADHNMIWHDVRLYIYCIVPVDTLHNLPSFVSSHLSQILLPIPIDLEYQPCLYMVFAPSRTFDCKHRDMGCLRWCKLVLWCCEMHFIGNTWEEMRPQTWLIFHPNIITPACVVCLSMWVYASLS